MLRSRIQRVHYCCASLKSREFATVSRAVIRPSNGFAPPSAPKPMPNLIEKQIVASLLAPRTVPSITLQEISEQYAAKAGTVLDIPLAYESRPSASRRATSANSRDSIFIVAHCASDGYQHKIVYSSGFALKAGERQEQNFVVTCTHTLEEIQRSMAAPPKLSGSFVIWNSSQGLVLNPVVSVASSLPRSDLLLLSCSQPQPDIKLKTLPLSPYPAQHHAKISLHLVSYHGPATPEWNPWLTGTWCKWASGSVLGYRDFAGREAEPGTYDTLSHLLFKPLPTPGSSGGPIVDEESGAVVGVMLGTRMDNRVEGMRGWGVPAEMIYEMFSLPGLEGKS